jgi:hypothetical protein
VDLIKELIYGKRKKKMAKLFGLQEQKFKIFQIVLKISHSALKIMD